jgi:arsenite methyltransferase
MDNDNNCCTSSSDSCDMFEFMSDHVGRKVLHPGGKETTKKLVDLLKINKKTKVLDIACGKGRTSIYLAEKYGCRVVGIDILQKSIEEAEYLAKKKGVEHLVSFKVADAVKLPFADNEFDVTLSQAVLVLVKNREKVIEEAARVLKSGGSSGWVEISWKSQPSDDFLADAQKEICAVCITNTETYEGWEKLFRKNGFKELAVYRADMERSMRKMMKDEGIINGSKIIYRYMTDAKIRERMKKLDNYFQHNPDKIGYGIYIGKK